MSYPLCKIMKTTRLWNMPSTGLCAHSCPFGILVPIWKFWLALPGPGKFLMGTMAWGLILPLFSPLTKAQGRVFLGVPDLTWGYNDYYANPWKPLWNGMCWVQVIVPLVLPPGSPKFLTGTLHLHITFDCMNVWVQRFQTTFPWLNPETDTSNGKFAEEK